MTAPTAAAETYIPVVGTTIILSGGGGTWAATVTEGGLTHTYEVDEMTNNVGLGHYEDVKTVDKYEGDIEIAFKTASPCPITSGDIFSTAITPVASSGAPSFTGLFRYNGFMYPYMNPKAGIKLKGKITSQGTITVGVA